MTATGPAFLLNDAPINAIEHPIDGDTAAVLSLRPLKSDARVPAISLPAGRYVVGSDPASDILLELPGVHPRHCLIIAGPARAAVCAYGAPIRLNGRPVGDAPLASGDVLTIGSVKLRVTQILSPHATEDKAPFTKIGNERLRGPDAAAVSPEAERLLNEIQQRFDAPKTEQNEASLRRQREELLRRENDANINAAATAATAAKLHEEREDLRIERKQIERMRRRLESEREKTAAASATERSALIAERTELLRLQKQFEADSAALARQRQQLKSQRTEEHGTRETASQSLDERERLLARAESNAAWRERELEEQARDLELLRAELADQQAELNRRAAADAEAAKQRESLLAELARLEQARHELDMEEERHQKRVARRAATHCKPIPPQTVDIPVLLPEPEREPQVQPELESHQATQPVAQVEHLAGTVAEPVADSKSVTDAGNPVVRLAGKVLLISHRQWELTLKGVMTAISIGISATLVAATFRSNGGTELWQSIVGYLASVVVIYDFLATLTRNDKH